MPRRKFKRSATMVPGRPKWLPKTGPGNLAVRPDQWGMTMQQWVAFVMACELTDEWDEMEAAEDHVNLYQVCKGFIKPWTRNLGNSIALLMNGAHPLTADLMISHAWGECIIECMIAILSRASVMGLTLEDTIWFCAFAQYQPGDEPSDCGPTVEQQLALDPFSCVIASKPRHGMLVVHTATQELYERLWCVYEVNEAELAGVTTSAAFSMAYLSELPNVDDEEELWVSSKDAKCFSKADADLIKKRIRKGSGYEALDSKIFDFRVASLTRMRGAWNAFYEWIQADFDGSEEKATEFLVDVVNYAGFFVGCHCLLGFVEEADDQDQLELICLRTREIIEFFRDGFSGVESSPPFFDERKAANAPNWDDVLRDDLSQFELAIGYLEMGSGGSLSAMCLNAEHISDTTLKVSGDAIKQLFRRHDKSGSGKIGKTELRNLLRLLDQDLTEHELDIVFNIADRDNSGSLDYAEFVDWLGTSLHTKSQ